MVIALFGSKEIYTKPGRWLDLAKLIGQLKGEINPEIEHVGLSSRFVLGETDEERQKWNDDYNRRLAMSNYQVSLKNSIRSLTGRLIMHAHSAEFDDDATERKTFALKTR